MTGSPEVLFGLLVCVAALLGVVIGLLLRVLAAQRTAVRVARQTRHDAATAATDAALAAETSQKVLAEIKRVGLVTQGIAQDNQEAAAVVADDLQAQHDRADAVTSTEPGAAADAAATTPKGDE